MTKYLFILDIAVLVLLAAVLSGQASSADASILVALQQGPDGNIQVMDAADHWYEPHGQKLMEMEEAVANVAPPEYSLSEGRLRQYLDSSAFHIHIPPDSAMAFVPLDEGILVSTAGGLYLFREGQFKRYYQPAYSFPDSIVSFSLEQEKLAMLTSKGYLFVYDMNKQILTPLSPTKVSAIAWDKWKGLWYLSENKMEVDQTFVNKQGPDIIISGQTSMTLGLGEKGVLPYTVRYAPTRNRVDTYYRLNETEPWQRCESPKKIVLYDLEPGKYVLQLKSVGLNNSTTISQPIQLMVKSEDWLSQFWPWLAGAFGLLFLVAGWGQLRLRRELAQLSEDRDRIRLQYEVKNQKQRVGQLQMNPHFLFNTLNSISGLIALNENKKARKYLNEFSQMMRKVLEGSKSDYLTIAAEIKFLNHYLSLEKMSRNDSFDYEIISEIDTENIQLPAMILQPFVENAILHGLKQKKSGGKLFVKFKQENNYLTATIEDNGIGRAAASAFRSEGHDSAAIDIITQRIETLDKWGQGGVEYADLYDENGAAAGTRVVVRVGSR